MLAKENKANTWENLVAYDYGESTLSQISEAQHADHPTLPLQRPTGRFQRSPFRDAIIIAKVSARALHVKGNKRTPLGGMKPCDGSTRQGYNKSKSQGQSEKVLAFSPGSRPYSLSCPRQAPDGGARAAVCKAGIRRRHQAGTRRIRPALGTAATAAPTAPHRAAEPARQKGLGGGRAAASRSLSSATQPLSGAASQSPGGLENRRQGLTIAGTTRGSAKRNQTLSVATARRARRLTP